ncbi:unnamed protein product [Diatraea saccharalis]|uniref:Uncharacterized protein n=1 Tax=Diatraea saccharalis TaxID=40085 RepID=A0A9N9WL47_9NEOP|nr:unnamed protein product [Diatraea saccharalis]
MTSVAVITIVAALIGNVICAPAEVKGNDRGVDTIRSPANLSFEELNYLLRVRSGVDTPNVNPIYLTPCARAILGCCKENVMNGDCSESLNCGAYFFDVNPCDVKYIQMALESAKAFYEQFDNLNTN